MIKILIVEDFLPDRENLKEIISSFKNLDISVAGECENGLQAMELIGAIRPDIVISDIEMPLMDGLELARNVRRNHPEIKIIFCSLYNEFEYARKALYLDSYGYILKPVDPSELKECICKASQKAAFPQDANEYEKLRCVLDKSRPALVESLIKDMVFGLCKDDEDIWERIDFLGLKLEEGTFTISYIEIDDFDKITADLKIENRQIFSLKIYERIREILSAAGRDAVMSRLDDAHFAIINNYPAEAPAAEASRLFAGECERILFEFKRTDISLSIALSDSCRNIFSLGGLFEQCKYIMKHKYILGKGTVLTSSDIPESARNQPVDFNSLQKEIRFLLNSGTHSGIEEYIATLHANIPENADGIYLRNLHFCIVICIQLVLNENNESFEALFSEEKPIWEKLIAFETIADSSNWIKDVLLFTNDYLLGKANRKNKVISGEVKQYIERNLTRSLGLVTIATDLYYSPNYLNYVFKLETGETISDYIIRRKIEKAKELLSDPRAKAFEISQILGYSHPSYFGNVFKKYTGLTPNEYRERYLI